MGSQLVEMRRGRGSGTCQVAIKPPQFPAITCRPTRSAQSTRKTGSRRRTHENGTYVGCDSSISSRVAGSVGSDPRVRECAETEGANGDEEGSRVANGRVGSSDEAGISRDDEGCGDHHPHSSLVRLHREVGEREGREGSDNLWIWVSTKEGRGGIAIPTYVGRNSLQLELDESLGRVDRLDDTGRRTRQSPNRRLLDFGWSAHDLWIRSSVMPREYARDVTHGKKNPMPCTVMLSRRKMRATVRVVGLKIPCLKALVWNLSTTTRDPTFSALIRVDARSRALERQYTSRNQLEEDVPFSSWVSQVAVSMLSVRTNQEPMAMSIVASPSRKKIMRQE